MGAILSTYATREAMNLYSLSGANISSEYSFLEFCLLVSCEDKLGCILDKVGGLCFWTCLEVSRQLFFNPASFSVSDSRSSTSDELSNGPLQSYAIVLLLGCNPMHVFSEVILMGLTQ